LHSDDIFSLDKVLFPINIFNRHWALAVAFMQQKKIVYYDSQSAGNNSGMSHLSTLRRYIQDEAAAKHRQFVLGEWKLVIEQVPQQMNGNDCGVFTCLFADLVLDDIDVNNLDQHMMEVFRRKICYAILRRKIPYPL
jgi:sentrin-specific protease 1